MTLEFPKVPRLRGFAAGYKFEGSNVTSYSGLLVPDDRWIVEITCNKVNEQFRGMAKSCCLGSLVGVPVPHESLDEMWRVSDVYVCTKQNCDQKW